MKSECNIFLDDSRFWQKNVIIMKMLIAIRIFNDEFTNLIAAAAA